MMISLPILWMLSLLWILCQSPLLITWCNTYTVPRYQFFYNHWKSLPRMSQLASMAAGDTKPTFGTLPQEVRDNIQLWLPLTLRGGDYPNAILLWASEHEARPSQDQKHSSYTPSGTSLYIGSSNVTEGRVLMRDAADGKFKRLENRLLVIKRYGYYVV